MARSFFKAAGLLAAQILLLCFLKNFLRLRWAQIETDAEQTVLQTAGITETNPDILENHSTNPFSKIMESLLQTTSNSFCPCCGWSGPKFNEASGRLCECPVCRSRERHRLACYELSNESLTTSNLPHPFRLVHFGAHMEMEKQLNTMERLDQVSVDFFYPGYNIYSELVLKADVTDLKLPDNFAQGIIILHVLEHISKLETAIDELERVLHRFGWIMFEVPCFDEPADCRSARNDTERLRCAGQIDHVWKFTRDNFNTMTARFDCTFPNEVEIGTELVSKAGFRNVLFGGCHAICRPNDL